MTMLYALCGMAFAGKSTASRRVAAVLGAERVSLDEIHAARGLDPGADLAVETWRETGEIAEERTRAALRAGRSTVVDDTFSYRRQRDAFRALADEEGAGFLILFLDTPEDVRQARIAANRLDPRRPDVLPHVVDFIRREFERPRADEPHLRFADAGELEAWLAGAAR